MTDSTDATDDRFGTKWARLFTIDWIGSEEMNGKSDLGKYLKSLPKCLSYFPLGGSVLTISRKMVSSSGKWISYFKNVDQIVSNQGIPKKVCPVFAVSRDSPDNFLPGLTRLTAI
ncbi:MAG: hypothetical protein PHR06_07185 [Candidatus Cloacimonetes bacterium]|nr:hypothetical protein [Candidatus Cloacimonadota bacterium]